MKIKLKPRKSLDKKNSEETNDSTENINDKKSTKGRSRSAGNKEKPKPWGRAERYLVLFILLSTTLSSATLALSARAWKLPGLPQLTLPKFNFSQTYVIEPNATQDQDLVEIEDEFKRQTNSLTGIYGFYVIRLYDNVAYGVNEDRVFQAASLIKLPAIAAIYAQSELGNISLEDTYTLINADKIAGSGSLYGKEPGTILTYEELAFLMANQSDNTAFGVTRKLLGDEIITKSIKNFGMLETSLENNKTTPKDIAFFFKRLYRDTFLTISSRNQIINALTNTSYEDYLPAGIPEEIKVAHKYGREVHVLNDGGIVFADDPYIVVFMTEGIIDKEAEEIIPRLSKLIYDFENKQN